MILVENNFFMVLFIILGLILLFGNKNCLSLLFRKTFNFSEFFLLVLFRQSC